MPTMVMDKGKRQPQSALSVYAVDRVIHLAIVLLASVDFTRDVRPILSDRCYTCHGPDANKRKTAMRLDDEKSAKTQLKSKRFAIVPGKPEESELYQRVVSTNAGLRMPPAYNGHAKLNDVETGILKQWIAEGAPFQLHWSLVPPQRDAGASIDSLVRARIALDGIVPAVAADKRTLLRRATFDLTGLPPTPEELNAFVNDASLQAYEKAVDRLLASPRYAERMAIRWLEAARYADTNGYQTDGARDMSRYRDWVIEAFAGNKRFDQFTIEQLAGDLLPNATLDQKIATGFHRNHRTTAEGGIVDEEWRVEYVADRAETTSTVWLGMTIGCARCHDHKYDPLKQKEFYQLFAFFNNNRDEKGFVYNFGNERPFLKAPTPPQEKEWLRRQTARDAALAGWNESRGEVAKAQAVWEKQIARRDLDWVSAEGLVFDGQLFGDTKFDGKRVVEYDDATAKFDHREPYTMSTWVKPQTRNGAILTRTEDYMEGPGYGLYVMDGKLRFHYIFRWTDLGMRLETRQELKQGEWQHVAVTYDGGMYTEGVHLYINGVEVEKTVLFNSNLWPNNHKAPLRIGAGSGLGFEGEVKHPRIWNRAMRADEVAAVALEETLSGAARKAERSKAEQAKLDLAFREQHLPARLAALKRDWLGAEQALGEFEKKLPTVMVMDEGPKRDAFVLLRGAYDAHGEEVDPQTPAVLHEFKKEWPRNRLGLAKWIVSRENPLTARVTVNRYWQMLFGVGLVKTVEDFGSQGELPIQRELLDWLAVEFMDNGWDVKGILKMMVMSETYRQSSHASAEALAKDPENRFLARGPRMRLSPEMIRDQALAVSGLLVEKQGGPSVKPYQPAGLWQELAGGDGYKRDTGEGLYRRSLYTYWRRTIAPPSMVGFDSPNRETCVVRETRTNTPLQALTLMNDETYLEASRKLAERALQDADPLRSAFVRAIGRDPSARESEVLAKALRRFEARFAGDPEAAKKLLAVGDSKSAYPDVAKLAAYASVASMILNLDEAVTK